MMKFRLWLATLILGRKEVDSMWFATMCANLIIEGELHFWEVKPKYKEKVRKVLIAMDAKDLIIENPPADGGN